MPRVGRGARGYGALPEGRALCGALRVDGFTSGMETIMVVPGLCEELQLQRINHSPKATQSEGSRTGIPPRAV